MSVCCNRWCLSPRAVSRATPLEETGFEPSVPPLFPLWAALSRCGSYSARWSPSTPPASSSAAGEKPRRQRLLHRSRCRSSLSRGWSDRPLPRCPRRVHAAAAMTRTGIERPTKGKGAGPMVRSPSPAAASPGAQLVDSNTTGCNIQTWRMAPSLAIWHQFRSGHQKTPRHYCTAGQPPTAENTYRLAGTAGQCHNQTFD